MYCFQQALLCIKTYVKQRSIKNTSNLLFLFSIVINIENFVEISYKSQKAINSVECVNPLNHFCLKKFFFPKKITVFKDEYTFYNCFVDTYRRECKFKYTSAKIVVQFATIILFGKESSISCINMHINA